MDGVFPCREGGRAAICRLPTCGAPLFTQQSLHQIPPSPSIACPSPPRRSSPGTWPPAFLPALSLHPPTPPTPSLRGARWRPGGASPLCKAGRCWRCSPPRAAPGPAWLPRGSLPSQAGTRRVRDGCEHVWLLQRPEERAAGNSFFLCIYNISRLQLNSPLPHPPATPSVPGQLLAASSLPSSFPRANPALQSSPLKENKKRNKIKMPAKMGSGGLFAQAQGFWRGEGGGGW